MQQMSNKAYVDGARALFIIFCGKGVGLYMVDKSKSMEILLDPVSLSVFIALLISTVTTLYIVCRLHKRKVSFVKYLDAFEGLIDKILVVVMFVVV